MSDVANIFIRMRRRSTKNKPYHIDCSSGAPQTHPSLAGVGATSPQKIEVEFADDFVCANGVDVVRLLRATRATLLETATLWNANVLVNERWTCTICVPKHRREGTFKVHISYSASATRSSRPDPQRPVAIEKAKGVPGLMTICERRNDVTGHFSTALSLL
jgi:hypothetical protein